MAKKWIAINLLLLVVAGLLGWELRASILRFIAENDPAKIQPTRDKKPATAQTKPLAPLAQEKTATTTDYSIIPEKTIFSDLRGKEDLAETMAPPEPPQLTPKPILVGTIIADNQYKALIIDPAGSGPDRNRRPEAKRIGDVYRGFTITSISANNIVLENSGRREIIPLHEGTKRAQQGKTAILATRVVPFGGTGAIGGLPAAATSRGATAAPTPATPTGVSSRGQQTVTMPGVGQGRQTTTTNPPTTQGQTNQTTTTPTQPGTPSTGTGTGTRTRSPFGDIIRPNRN